MPSSPDAGRLRRRTPTGKLIADVPACAVCGSREPLALPTTGIRDVRATGDK